MCYLWIESGRRSRRGNEYERERERGRSEKEGKAAGGDGVILRDKERRGSRILQLLIIDKSSRIESVNNSHQCSQSLRGSTKSFLQSKLQAV